MTTAALQLFEENLEKNGGLADRALAETIQYIALLGISRTDFFSHAAFYGGTALRILYGLDRFSEDLDFSLIEPESDFSIKNYLKSVQHELESYNFIVHIEQKAKKTNTVVDSAFIKANTKLHIITTNVERVIADKIPKNAVCKVKLEIDTDPPSGASFDVGYIDDPVPFSIRSYDKPSLFAGKMAALLARQWKTRVKGRDWYDFTFFIRKKIPLSLHHLEARLRQVGYYTDAKPLDNKALLDLVQSRIYEVDFENAKADVIRFIRNPQDLDVWSKDFFLYMLNKMIIQ